MDIGCNPNALHAVRTAIFAPGIDPVIKIATVSLATKFNWTIRSTIAAEKLGSNVVNLESRSPSSVVIKLKGLPTNPVSFGSFSISMKTLDSILVSFNVSIAFFISLAALTFASYEPETSMVLMLTEIIKQIMDNNDNSTRVEVF